MIKSLENFYPRSGNSAPPSSSSYTESSSVASSHDGGLDSRKACVYVYIYTQAHSCALSLFPCFSPCARARAWQSAWNFRGLRTATLLARSLAHVYYGRSLLAVGRRSRDREPTKNEQERERERGARQRTGTRVECCLRAAVCVCVCRREELPRCELYVGLVFFVALAVV